MSGAPYTLGEALRAIRGFESEAFEHDEMRDIDTASKVGQDCIAVLCAASRLIEFAADQAEIIREASMRQCATFYFG